MREEFDLGNFLCNVLMVLTLIMSIILVLMGIGGLAIGGIRFFKFLMQF